jgi:hypothetical protein
VTGVQDLGLNADSGYITISLVQWMHLRSEFEVVHIHNNTNTMCILV